MRLSEVWRTTSFRLSVVYGAVFAVAIVALLGVVYLQTVGYLTARVDRILNAQADAQMSVPSPALIRRIDDALTLSGARTSLFALFTPDGRRITGNLPREPAGLAPGGAPVEISDPAMFPTSVRMIARRLPSGEVLVVGRDINQLRQIRQIIGSTLVWSGGLTLAGGLASGAALSIAPMRRLRALQAAGQEIAAGALRQRMPISQHGDELDMFAATVNAMVAEIERLMGEVRTATETLAHDLRTPLTRARSQLHRLELAGRADPADIARVTAELDEVLERFRAILRISEIESRARTAAFGPTDLAALVAQAAELYQPLAEEAEVSFEVAPAPAVTIEADAKLLFEAVSNLVDNAIKFTGPGGRVRLLLEAPPKGPRIVVADDGPGVPAEERTAVLQRFYRSERDRLTPGSGLGLSVVAAIVRLHRFELHLEDARPGLRAVIDCRSAARI